MVAVLLSSGTTTLVAQAPADFSGYWTHVADSNARAGSYVYAGLGATPTIVQNSKTLTITAPHIAPGTFDRADLTTVYNLDGSDSKNTLPATGGGTTAINMVCNARWEGAKLVVSSTASFAGRNETMTLTYSLDTSGNLVVLSTVPNKPSEPVTYKKGVAPAPVTPPPLMTGPAPINFSGRWTPIAGDTGTGTPIAVVGVAPVTIITQDEKTLTIETPGVDTKTVYNLDGSDSKGTLAGMFPTVTRVAWDGAKLVATMKVNSYGTDVTSTTTFNIDASGNLIRVLTVLGRAAITITYKKG